MTNYEKQFEESLAEMKIKNILLDLMINTEMETNKNKVPAYSLMIDSAYDKIIKITKEIKNE